MTMASTVRTQGNSIRVEPFPAYSRSRSSTTSSSASEDSHESLEKAPILEDGSCFVGQPEKQAKWTWKGMKRRISLEKRKGEEHYGEKVGASSRSSRSSGWAIWICVGMPLLTFSGFIFLRIISGLIALGPLFWNEPIHLPPALASWVPPLYPLDYLAQYPGSITEGVEPIPCHSHNDYWRRIPLLSALQAGCISVEADIWHFPDDPAVPFNPSAPDPLYVGHTTHSLVRNRTLSALYLDPLMHLLRAANPDANSTTEPTHGVFTAAPTQPLTLLIDFKTDGPSLLPHLRAALEPLRAAGYLTYYNTTTQTLHRGPLTIVATGAAPFDLLTAPAPAPHASRRDIFFDAPLAALSATPATLDASRTRGGQGLIGVGPDAVFDPSTSFYASVSFKKSIARLWPGRTFSLDMRRRVREQVRAAHARGLKVRYWGTPGWPAGLRDGVARVLVEEGADVVGVDELVGVRDVVGGGRRGGGEGE